MHYGMDQEQGQRMMDTQYWMDRLFGFMPYRAVIWTAIGIFVLSEVMRFISQWINSLTRLPWMEEKNELRRTANSHAVNEENTQ